MSRLAARAAVTVMLASAATWMVPGPMVTPTVLRARARPTWIRCPPAMMAPRTQTRRVTTRRAGRQGGWAVPGRAPRSPGRTGQATVRTRTPAGQDAGDRAARPQGDALPGQRQPGADDVVAGADAARGVHGPVGLDHVPGCRGQRRRVRRSELPRRPGGPGRGHRAGTAGS